LITTYGIPEDILSVNEYGGYNIYDIAGIQELNNDNITTGSVLNISSSLLSPFTTLQYYQNNFDRTSPDVEVGFSPTSNINAAITSSGYVTSSTEPGYFNIMQYIGAPDLQYTPTYAPLVELENTFFENTFTGNAETGLTRYNIWDFIRTVKYYNNSLFKMMKDFVPARANLSTGIIIRSHILERNKYARHQPTATIEGGLSAIDMVYVEGSAPGGYLYNTSYTASIPVQYQSSSNYLGNASGKIPYISNTGIENYTGQYSGSNLYISNYFPQVGVSSYLAPNTSSVPPSQHGGQNIMFTTYSLNCLINNVTGSVISQKFLDLDYNNNQIVPVNYGLITQSISQSNVIGPYSQSQQPYSQYAQVQDYNYYLLRSTIPRYSGSYLSGLYYNTYTPQNATYSGDISYGNSPIIDYYTSKLGLFVQMQSSSFIPGAVNASLAYQADVSGGLSELNQNNKSWQDIQNTYVAGDTLTIKQFDNKKYSNQVATDGVKTIYNSGYNYTPQLYFDTASDPRIYFQFNGAEVSSTLLVENQSNFFISGAVSPRYPLKVISSTGVGKANGFIYNIFDNIITDTSGYYTAGVAATNNFPTYSAPYAGVRTFNTNFSINVVFTSSNQQVTYSYTVAENGVPENTIVQSFKSTQIAGSTTPGIITTGDIVRDSTPTLIPGSTDTFTGPFYVDGSLTQTGGSNTIVTTNQYYWTEKEAGDRSGQLITSITGTAVAGVGGTVSGGGVCKEILEISSATSTELVDNLTTTLTFNSSVEVNSAGGDKITFELREILNGTSQDYTASVNAGSLTVGESSAAQGVYPYASTGSARYITGLSNNGSFGIISCSADLSNFYQSYQQVPYFTSGSPNAVIYSSSLYNQYGDINSAFYPQPYDKIILKDKNGAFQDLDVYTASLSGSQLYITTFPSILDNWVNTPSLVQQFLLLRRYEDEQNVIVTYNKPPGQTSYGFLISNTTSPEITNNINTLQAAVQSQILSTQTAI